VANLKRVPTWLLVEELMSRKETIFVSVNNSGNKVITVKNVQKPSKDKKEGNK
jgi:hypothetical protein